MKDFNGNDVDGFNVFSEMFSNTTVIVGAVIVFLGVFLYFYLKD